VLAQQQAARRRPGITLITDGESERRQLEADAARRRRIIWRLVLATLAVLMLGAWILMTAGRLDF